MRRYGKDRNSEAYCATTRANGAIERRFLGPWMSAPLSGRTSATSTLTTIDMQYFSRDERCGIKIENRFRDIAHLT